MPSSTGSEPPDRLVPLPRATNGTRGVVAQPDGLDDLVGGFGEDHGARAAPVGRQSI